MDTMKDRPPAMAISIRFIPRNTASEDSCGGRSKAVTTASPKFSTSKRPIETILSKNAWESSSKSVSSSGGRTTKSTKIDPALTLRMTMDSGATPRALARDWIMVSSS